MLEIDNNTLSCYINIRGVVPPNVGHFVSHQSGSHIFVCASLNIACLHVHLEKYRPSTAFLLLISIMIWRLIEHVLKKGVTWIARKCIWKQVQILTIDIKRYLQYKLRV